MFISNCARTVHGLAVLAIVATGLVLAGCKPSMEVRLASAMEWLPEPRFIIEEVDRRGVRPRYEAIAVYDASGKLLWRVLAEPYGDENSVRDVTYGIAPEGFKVTTPAQPLVPNAEHVIVIEGKARGYLRFRGDASGHVDAIRD